MLQFKLFKCYTKTFCRKNSLDMLYQILLGCLVMAVEHIFLLLTQGIFLEQIHFQVPLVHAHLKCTKHFVLLVFLYLISTVLFPLLPLFVGSELDQCLAMHNCWCLWCWCSVCLSEAASAEGRDCLQCPTPGCDTPCWGHCAVHSEHTVSQRTPWSSSIALGTGKRHNQNGNLNTQLQWAPGSTWLEQLPWLNWKVLAGGGRCHREVPVPAGTCQERDAALLTEMLPTRANCLLQMCGSVSTDKSFVLFVTCKTRQASH